MARKEVIPEYGRFFTYQDENGRRVTISGDAIVEVIENGSEVHVNYGDSVPDLFTGETAEAFLQWWDNFKTI